MEERLLNLWNTQRIICVLLGMLLLPITLLILGIKIYILLNERGAKNSLSDTQKKDDVLSKEADELKEKANQALSEANKAAQRIENRHSENVVDLDWNKKRND